MKTIKSFQPRSSLTAARTLAILSLSLLLPASLKAASQKFTSSGTFTPPAGITSVTVECWGGGGAGGSTTRAGFNTVGGAAGGGAYAKKLNIPVTPGTPYTVTIPAAAVARATGSFAHGDRVNGANVTFTGDGGVSVTANGGQGGACNVGLGPTGLQGVGGDAGTGLDAAWAGGNGQTDSGTGGPAGSAASDLAAGSINGSTSTTSGSDPDHNGGAGGAGRTGAGNGNSGAAPGGGGAGGRTSPTVTTAVGGQGGRGQIIISYSGATVSKANNTDNLNLGSSWVGGNTPDATGIAKWDNTVTGANTTVLGADLAWGGINIANPGGLVTINAGHTLTNSGGIDMSAAMADLTLNCGLALGGPSIWNVAASRTLTVGGIVSGAQSITKQGDGKVILSAANTYSGATAINGGTLQLGGNDVIPHGTGKGDVSVAANCTLDLNGFSDALNGLSGAGIVDNTAASTASTLTVGINDVSSTFSGVIQNSGSASTNNLVKTGSGILTLSGVNTFSGTVTVNGGRLALANASALNNISGFTIGGATLGVGVANLVISAPITLSGNMTVIPNGAGATPVSFNGPIGGTGNISFTTEANTYSGADNRASIGTNGSFVGNITITTQNSANNMTVQLGTTNALPTTAVVTLDGGNGNGSTYSDLDLNGFDQTLAGLTNITRTTRLQRVYNAITNPTVTLTISNSTDYTFGGRLGKTGGDNFGLTKDGPGTFALSANNTYTGNTTISDGILLVNNTTGSGTGTGAVIVNGGTLGGIGTISGTVTVNSSATLAAGASIGTLTLNGVATNNGTIVAEITNGPSADKIVFSDSFHNLGGTLTVTSLGSLLNGTTYDLFDFNGGVPTGVAFAATNLPNGPVHWITSDLLVGGTITFTNNAPVAADFDLGVASYGSAVIDVVAKYAADADVGDALTLTGVSSANATIVGSTIVYTNASGENDSFTYTVSDGLASATGTVTVLTYSPTGFNRLSGPDNNGNGTSTINYLGIPNAQYVLETTVNLAPPVWMPIQTNTAAANGALSFTFDTSSGQGFFRTRHQP